MKRTYIVPEMLTLKLTMSNIIATSGDIQGGGNASDVIDNGGEGDVKVISGKNVWDNEW